ncbi:MAG: ribosome silencing factor [Spirochaetales bacterium]|nr:ribosome silencing factor [Spirochaetales bacterium]
MDDIVKNEIVQAVADSIIEHNGVDTRVIDVRTASSWTDYFIISTPTSSGHLRGLIKYIRKTLSNFDVDIINRQKKYEEGGWVLLDCGYFVIHLMDETARDFYGLEKLWHEGVSK